MSKTAVITGAGSGVGQAIALKLAQQHWRVAIIGRRAEALQETIALAGSHASRITPAMSAMLPQSQRWGKEFSPSSAK